MKGSSLAKQQLRGGVMKKKTAPEQTHKHTASVLRSSRRAKVAQSSLESFEHLAHSKNLVDLIPGMEAGENGNAHIQGPELAQWPNTYFQRLVDLVHEENTELSL